MTPKVDAAISCRSAARRKPIRLAGLAMIWQRATQNRQLLTCWIIWVARPAWSVPVERSANRVQKSQLRMRKHARIAPVKPNGTRGRRPDASRSSVYTGIGGSGRHSRAIFTNTGFLARPSGRGFFARRCVSSWVPMHHAGARRAAASRGSRGGDQRLAIVLRSNE